MVAKDLREEFSRRRFWFALLSVLPFSIMFLIGILTISNYLPIVLEFDNYKEEEMTIISIDGSDTPGGVSQSIDARGTVKGKKTSVYLGFTDDHWVKDILNKLGTVGRDTIPVVYNRRTNHAIYQYGKTRNEIKDVYISKFAKSLIFLVAPFVICLTLAISYHIKLKQIKDD